MCVCVEKVQGEKKKEETNQNLGFEPRNENNFFWLALSGLVQASFPNLFIGDHPSPSIILFSIPSLFFPSTLFSSLFSFLLSFSFCTWKMLEHILEAIEPTLLKIEYFIKAIAADVPLETDWAQSSYGSW